MTTSSISVIWRSLAVSGFILATPGSTSSRLLSLNLLSGGLGEVVATAFSPPLSLREVLLIRAILGLLAPLAELP